ncbi:hypothetical protein ATE92_1750 [Ulvibacter sp. MAR_2010_11]|uniref:hypothetical protein n=1 Tax=Ulvibacter sp. MAR_2010_11 TaxID=1250229 RepID=UPI000C2B82D1|nr:hypothetical protein [Ulvibacter sp. MAR_2010_11]PKA83593.1 hypothetical protein ATE92_1750 [Ulvibacter sp. MAR_2010_11]
MAFTKESASKAGQKSSRKGTPNKATPLIRDAFNKLIEDNIDKMGDWLEQVAESDPAKAFDIISKLSDFVIPKLNRTEVENVTSLEDLISLSPEERKKRIIQLRKKSTTL